MLLQVWPADTHRDELRRIWMRSVILLFCVVVGSAGAAAVAADEGTYSGALRTMLTQAAAGTCPADIMGEGLLKACREQIANMAPALKAAGPIQSITFVRAEQLNGERFETYKVSFATGAPSNWHIGALHGNKFDAVFSNGE